MSRKLEKITVACGDYDPLELYDLYFLKKCKDMGDWLIVGVHSDPWLLAYRGGFVQNHNTRREILSNIKFIDEVFSFNDSDGSASQLLKIIKQIYPHTYITYVSMDDMVNSPETKVRGITFQTIK